MHLFGACPLRISSRAQVKATPGAAAYGACTTANIQGPCGGMAWLTCMRCDAKPSGLRRPGAPYAEPTAATTWGLSGWTDVVPQGDPQPGQERLPFRPSLKVPQRVPVAA